MKLLIASSAPTDGGGGISAYARSIAVALADAGHEIHYASPAHLDSSFVDRHGIIHVETDSEGDPIQGARGLLDYIEKKRIEAMALGVLPIATDGIGAMRWLIESGHEGFIVHLRDFNDQLAQCIDFIAQRPTIVTSMKQAARARYLADFQASQNAARVIDLIKRTTVDRTGPAQPFKIVKRHRPTLFSRKRPTFMRRVRCRAGLLEHAGSIEMEHGT